MWLVHCHSLSWSVVLCARAWCSAQRPKTKEAPQRAKCHKSTMAALGGVGDCERAESKNTQSCEHVFLNPVFHLFLGLHLVMKSALLREHVSVMHVLCTVVILAHGLEHFRLVVTNNTKRNCFHQFRMFIDTGCGAYCGDAPTLPPHTTLCWCPLCRTSACIHYLGLNLRVSVAWALSSERDAAAGGSYGKPCNVLAAKQTMPCADLVAGHRCWQRRGHIRRLRVCVEQVRKVWCCERAVGSAMWERLRNACEPVQC